LIEQAGSFGFELHSERIPRSLLVGAQRKSRLSGAAGLVSELKN